MDIKGAIPVECLNFPVHVFLIPVGPLFQSLPREKPNEADEVIMGLRTTFTHCNLHISFANRNIFHKLYGSEVAM